MNLIVGLGNPGPTYENNRHNIGFFAVNQIHQFYGFNPWRIKFDGELSIGKIDNKKILILKPMTFMNDSGRSIQKAISFYHLTAENVIVIHDELDLPEDTVKLKRGGGHAGHNGLRSTHAHIGPNYARVRIGIGRPTNKKTISNYVLNDFAPKDYNWLSPMVGNIAKYIQFALNNDDPAFVNQVTEANKIANQ